MASEFYARHSTSPMKAKHTSHAFYFLSKPYRIDPANEKELKIGAGYGTTILQVIVTVSTDMVDDVTNANSIIVYIEESMPCLLTSPRLPASQCRQW